MLPMFLAVSDQTIVASALPAMSVTLGDVERISWVVVSYLVAATIAAPVYGYLGDVFGRRRLMFGALALFMGASVLCAIAPTVLLLSAARVLQGFGGGGLMSLSQALIGEVVPPRQRGHYQGYLATVATVSSVFGPVAGGFLTEHLGWKSIFLVNLPLGALALLLVMRLQSRPGTRHEQWSFDAPGLFYFVAFIAPILVAMEQVRQFDPASAPMVAGLFAIALIALVLLVRRERATASPLLPIDLLIQPTIWRANCLAACHGAALTSLIAFLPIYLRVVHGLSASQTGLMLLPVSIGIGVGSIITGRMVTRTGLTMVFPSWGLVGATLGLGAFALFGADLEIPWLLAILSLSSICMGTVMTVVQVTIQTAAGRKALGAAAGSVQFSRTVGAALGTALLGAILFATLALSDADAAPLFARLIDVGTSAFAALPPDRQAMLTGVIANAFRLGFSLVALFAGIGIVLAWSNPTRRV
jgi:EmrB/QacA subfamily drug resistance transporter